MLEEGALLDTAGTPLLPAPADWRGPGLILTGASSSAAPPESILPAFGAIAEDQAISYRMFSRINGHLADYGHGDVLLSWHSPWDLDPLLWGWLRDCDHGAEPGCADHRLKLEQRGGRRSLRQPGHGSRSR